MILSWDTNKNGAWNAKLVPARGGPKPLPAHVDIRKLVRGVHTLISVSLGGFRTNNKYMIEYKWKNGIEEPTCNIKMGQNGTAFWTFQQWGEFQEAIKEAKQFLESLTP
jgi:hypothetical protein